MTRDLIVWGGAGALVVVVLGAILITRGPMLRYILAMAFASSSALSATLFLANPIANYVTSRLRFESPDGAADTHILTFLGVNISALLIGWLFGWLVSGPLIERTRVR